MFHGFNIFLILSAIGWLIDILVFTYFSVKFNFSPFISNFFSSLIATLLVWATWYAVLFKPNFEERTILNNMLKRALIYCSYQIFSILLYSILITIVFNQVFQMITNNYVFHFEPREFTLVISKILITPFNLLTNFIFAKLLTQWR